MALLVVLVVAYFVYLPGANGPYMYDDIENIKNNTRLRIDTLSLQKITDAAFSVGSGPSGRPISMLSFAANYRYADSANPSALKITNILIHLLTGLCVYYLSLLLSKRSLSSNDENTQSLPHWIAFVVAALWLLHPLNTSTVLYTVQRMAQLSAFFCLASASLYVAGRNRLLTGERNGWIWIGISIVAGTTLATFSKENGALLPALLLVIELAFFRFRFHGSASRHARQALVTVLLGPVAILLGYMGYAVWTVGMEFPQHPFTLAERLMTECRVIWFYIGNIILPDITSMGLFHDDFALSKGLFSPATTFIALVGIALVLAVAMYGLVQSRYPVLCFGISWFLAGHLLESTVLPLELVFEHRNYLPGFGLFFMAGFFICNIKVRGNRYSPVKIITVAAVFTGLMVTLHDRVDQWSDPMKFIVAEFRNHPESARAAGAMANAYYQLGKFEDAVETHKIAARNNPEEAGYLIEAAMASYQLEGKVPSEMCQQIVDRISSYPVTPATWSKLYAMAGLYVQSHFDDNLLLEPVYRAVVKKKSVAYTPHVGPIYYELGSLAARQGQWADAVNSWEHVLAVNPDPPLALRFMLGEAYFHVGRLEDAMEMIRYFENVKLDPQGKQKLDGLIEKISLQPGDNRQEF